ncbi:MAG TPA: hypothetical protein VF648_17840 [Pyrinomonadaceae bacterium]|jgi:hypothetical protein
MSGESYIPSMFWADTILLFAGLFVIALAIFLSQRLGRSPVSFNFSKLGMDFRADRLTFVLIVGLLLISVGVFFRYRDYEKTYQDYEKKLQKNQSELQELNYKFTETKETLSRIENTINKTSGYNLDIEVVFPNEVKKADVKNFIIKVSTERRGEGRRDRGEIKPQYIEEDNKYEFKILGLMGNEIVRVFAVDKNNQDNILWKSGDITILEKRTVEMKQIG